MGGLRRKLRIVQRGLFLLTVWGAAAYFAVLACGAAVAHQRVQSDLAQMHAQTKQEFEAYSKDLAKGEQLTQDKEYQANLLKENYGYTKPDETPVIILQGNE